MTQGKSVWAHKGGNLLTSCFTCCLSSYEQI